MRARPIHNENGQILIWVALSLGILVLFTALAVDMGVIFMNKARLANSVDAAVLTGVRNYAAEGQATAQNLANDMFVANFGSSAPNVTYSWCPDPHNPNCTTAISLTAHATSYVNTAFMKYLPQWAQWQLGDTATATRSNLVMTLVLDRSGSMCGGSDPCPPFQSGDQGGQALQSAVPTFINNFVEGSDHIGMVSFSSNATTDVPITTSFKTPVDNAVAAMTFAGGTFGGGAGTNTCTGACATTDGPPLSMADYQNNSVVLGAREAEVKVVVYFTDGLMNTIQDTLACTNLGNTVYNFGGYDSGSTFDFFNPADNNQTTNDLSNWYSGTPAGFGGGCTNLLGNGQGLCGTNPPYNSSARCLGVTQFFSQQYQTMENFSRSNITAETQWRAIYTANAMRSENPVPTYIFAIGLGHGVSGSPSTEAFLSTLANDPNGPGSYPGAVYNSSLPGGLFVVVPDCPSPTCTQELTTAFQTIAAKILLRLSQ